jgi:deoxyhypusine synthase
MKTRRIDPPPIEGGETVTELVDRALLAYNGARLGEACRLLREKVLAEDVTVGLTLAGALTPAGLGASVVVPLLDRGCVDFVVSTGANLYHDLHFALDLPLDRDSPFHDDAELRRRGRFRIYDITAEIDVLLRTDRYVRDGIAEEVGEAAIGSAELHHALGRRADDLERRTGRPGRSLLAAAFRASVPVYVPSPGDSTIGLNLAALALVGSAPPFDVSRDVNETAAIVHGAKTSGGKTAALIAGGGSPKNFLLQTGPHLEEILGLGGDFGLDYFIQLTDARPDTGGLSGATPSEAVSWGKVLPEQLPDAVVCYVDSTVSLPILASYALSGGTRRPSKRLYDRREELVAALRKAALEAAAGCAGGEG